MNLEELEPLRVLVVLLFVEVVLFVVVELLVSALGEILEN